jgi:two-component system cell cycle sensor histidine kinase/response regulator CckA
MQAVGQLAGGIAHDFNNLLTAMIGFCDLLLLRHKPGDPSFADIMQIKQNANRAANLVRQLLAFSRQQTLQPRVLDMTDVLSELSHLLRRLIGANIELEMNHGSDLGLIKADQGQMDQVLINLVVNARDAMPQGGKVTVRTQNLKNPQGVKLSNDDMLPPGDWVTIVVEDTGTGIPVDILPHIFEPFFSTKDVGAGTGLGLATVHGIIHQTGGFISVTSVAGKGSIFTIYLPRYTETAAEQKSEVVEEKLATSDLTGSARILLVEDEDAVRTFSARALSNKGYQVMDAPGGAAALQLLAEGKIVPEILITDVMMPEMDGTTLAKQVKEKYPNVKIIFISGYAEDRFKEHLGADVWFLPKPFTLKQLATKVKEVIDEK